MKGNVPNETQKPYTNNQHENYKTIHIGIINIMNMFDFHCPKGGQNPPKKSLRIFKRLTTLRAGARCEATETLMH